MLPPPATLRTAFPVLLLLLAFALPLTTYAQESKPTVETAGPDIRVALSGGLQTRLSYGVSVPPEGNAASTTDRLGFGIRRARLRVRASIGPKAGLYLQLDGAGGSVSALDFYAQYQATPRLRFRLGRLVSAQPRSMVLTPLPQIDTVTRAAIAERWAGTTIGSDGRDFGLETHYAADQGEVNLFIHNGDGSWDRARSNYREDISSGNITRSTERTGLAVGGYGAYRPASVKGLEVGAFGGLNTSRNPNTKPSSSTPGRKYVAYGAHAYWGANPGSQAVRLKADLLGTAFSRSGGDRQHLLGLSFLAALRVAPAVEAFGRAERFETDINQSGTGDTYLTAGFNLSLSALRGAGAPFYQERLTLAYNGLFSGDDAAPTQHQVVLQALFFF